MLMQMFIFMIYFFVKIVLRFSFSLELGKRRAQRQQHTWILFCIAKKDWKWYAQMDVQK